MRRVRALLLLTLSVLLTGCPPPPSVAGGGKKNASPNATLQTGPIQSPTKPQDLGPPPPTEIETDGLKTGERYRFLTEQGTLTIRETWLVKAIEPGKEVRYDLFSITEVKGEEPRETGPTPKVLRLAIEDAPAPPGPPPVACGQETLEISGVRFECTIYRQGQTRRWISARFPRLIQLEQGGKPFRRLIGIDPPKK
ncbi:MAG: hypothetical protein JKY65_33375 [Planctomycetes bacterium]|nr:hypothetical protein [Planctomycetota bacterium]